MECTKLEKYLEIIKIVILKGPLEFAQLEVLLGFNKDELNRSLNFLVRQKVFEHLILNGLATYAATTTGLRIAEYFGMMSGKENV